MSSTGNHAAPTCASGWMPGRNVTAGTGNPLPERVATTRQPREAHTACDPTPTYGESPVVPDRLTSYAPLVQAACGAALGAALLLVGVLGALSPTSDVDHRKQPSPARIDVTISGQARH